MALLRQCLLELRVKRREWSASEHVWTDAEPFGEVLPPARMDAPGQSTGVSSGVRGAGSSTAAASPTPSPKGGENRPHAP